MTIALAVRSPVPAERVSNLYRMLGNQPELLRGFNQLYGAVWAEGALAAKLNDLAYLRVSILNGCGY